ncbi:hypothetical protein HD554DRAFT_2042598 [Boletus coccyginus]|nr:hypothetical protein HD554DRAFT_2042598 [Boletus coccyginus]
MDHLDTSFRCVQYLYAVQLAPSCQHNLLAYKVDFGGCIRGWRETIEHLQEAHGCIDLSLLGKSTTNEPRRKGDTLEVLEDNERKKLEVRRNTCYVVWDVNNLRASGSLAKNICVRQGRNCCLAEQTPPRTRFTRSGAWREQRGMIRAEVVYELLPTRCPERLKDKPDRAEGSIKQGSVSHDLSGRSTQTKFDPMASKRVRTPYTFACAKATCMKRTGGSARKGVISGFAERGLRHLSSKSCARPDLGHEAMANIREGPKYSPPRRNGFTGQEFQYKKKHEQQLTSADTENQALDKSACTGEKAILVDFVC